MATATFRAGNIWGDLNQWAFTTDVALFGAADTVLSVPAQIPQIYDVAHRNLMVKGVSLTYIRIGGNTDVGFVISSQIDIAHWLQMRTMTAVGNTYQSWTELNIPVTLDPAVSPFVGYIPAGTLLGDSMAISAWGTFLQPQGETTVRVTGKPTVSVEGVSLWSRR